jgi:3-deoxy-manno-octulosonate cytidylyltransferase (CMP-KDO synthetase)
MKSTVIIPARYHSSRLPGKPLLRETGKYLIQHVYEQASQARNIDSVIVATDDSRIIAAVESFGGRVVMTSPDHVSGTDRVAEVAHCLDADVIVNLQGDEPLIEPSAIEMLPTMLERNSEAAMATLAVPLTTVERWQNPNCTKVVCDDRGRALYFSRSPIPHVRDGQPDFAAQPPQFLQHLGIYAYRWAFLLRLAAQEPAATEQLEKLEQLRALALGRVIQVGIVAHSSPGVDTYEDYQEFVRIYRSGVSAHAA